jgi:hypothetical protein
VLERDRLHPRRPAGYDRRARPTHGGGRASLRVRSPRRQIYPPSASIATRNPRRTAR